MSNWNLAELRLSDRDRRSALRRVRREQARGRITHAELEERLDAIGTARTHGDLGPVFADLGGNGLGFAPRGRGYRRGFFPFPLVPLLVIAIIIAATGHIPWVPVIIAGALILVFAPWRRRRWADRYGYGC